VTGRWDHLPPLTDIIGTDKQGVADNQFGGGEIRLLNDTDGRGVRVERGRRGRSSRRIDNETIPGCFMENRLPMGGGWNNYEGGCLFLCLQFGRFTQGAEKSARKPKSPKSPLEKIVVR